MKNGFRGLALLLPLVLTAPAFAGGAQQVNPLFTRAQASAQAVAASSLGADVKQDFGRRWDSLDREQKQLWMIAGQVDAAVAAGNNPGFLDNYNQCVSAWQSNLQAFTADAANALARPKTTAEAGK